MIKCHFSGGNDFETSACHPIGGDRNRPVGRGRLAGAAARARAKQPRPSPKLRPMAQRRTRLFRGAPKARRQSPSITRKRDRFSRRRSRHRRFSGTMRSGRRCLADRRGRLPTARRPCTCRSRGERPRVGEIDPRCVAETNEPPTLAPQQASARSWTPDTETWESIKKHSVAGPATVTIHRLPRPSWRRAFPAAGSPFEPRKTPWARPIFYRDVPLMPAKLEKGVIQPFAKNCATADRLAAAQCRRAPQPAAVGGISPPAPTAIPSRATARRWGWTWTARRTTRGST